MLAISALRCVPDFFNGHVRRIGTTRFSSRGTDKVLLEFVGERSILLESDVRKCVSSAGIDPEQVDHVISQLVGLTFLGVEVGAGKFAYADEKKERQKNRQLATKFAVSQGFEPRYEVNAPFRTYLELNEADSSPRLL
jgi:hypothetical protein